MKKPFLTIMAIVGIGASAMAASNSNRYFTKGYRADVVSPQRRCSIST